MFTGVAFVPRAPALVPAIGRGLDAELAAVRAACRAAVARVTGPDTRLQVVGIGPGENDRALVRWLTDGSGAAVEGARGVLPDHVARHEELQEGRQEGRREDGAAALLVIGDGSARRTEKAPGYLDARAEAFDRDVAAALAGGDPDRLAQLDAVLGADLLAAGVPAWHEAAAHLAGASWRAELLHDDAPFGVGYFVAVWERRA